VTAPGTWRADVRRFLPLALLAGWSALVFLVGPALALLARRAAVIGPVSRVLEVAGALMLAAAMLLGLTRLARGADRAFSAIAAALAVLFYVGYTGFAFYGAQSERWLSGLAQDEAGMLERFGDRAWNAGIGKSGEAAAGSVYATFGVRIAYRDEAGTPRVFEPSPEHVARAEKSKQLRAELNRMRPDFERSSAGFRWIGFLYLIVLGLTTVVASVWLARPRPAPRSDG
jgi:hypothetical protein